MESRCFGASTIRNQGPSRAVGPEPLAASDATVPPCMGLEESGDSGTGKCGSRTSRRNATTMLSVLGTNRTDEYTLNSEYFHGIGASISPRWVVHVRRAFHSLRF